jgi:hypothetical protein
MLDGHTGRLPIQAIQPVTWSTLGTSGITSTSPVHPEQHPLFCSRPAIQAEYVSTKQPDTGPGTRADLAFRND